MGEFFITAEEAYDIIQESKDNLVILDQPYGKYQYYDQVDVDMRKYEKAHIPSAIKITSEEYDDENLNIKPAKEIEAMLLSKGIDCNTELMVYSDGIIAATRVAFIAYWAGVKDIKVIRGGFQSWLDAGYPVSDEIEEPQAKSDFGCSVPQHPEAVLSTPEDVIQKQKENPDFKLASLRSWEEFIGDKSGYSYINITGSPIGSVYTEASSDRRNVDKLMDDSGQIGDLDQLFEAWADWGVTPDQEVAFHCGSGWRASTAFFICKLSGWENVKIYDGGWYLWEKYHAENPERYPIQKGNPKDGSLEIIDYLEIDESDE